MKNAALPLTPLTDETFIRQKWDCHLISDNEDDEIVDAGVIDKSAPHFYTLSLPKTRKDKYAPILVTNASNDLKLLKEIGLKPGQFFVEISDLDGLGFCSSEEELEVLYRVLTGKYIEE